MRKTITTDYDWIKRSIKTSLMLTSFVFQRTYILVINYHLEHFNLQFQRKDWSLVPD